MSPRNYRMKQREESAIATRERIVRAVSELHTEKGVAGTTFRDIAARADVGIGTVYHHFPSYDEVITACGAYSVGVAKPPSPAIFDGIDDPAQRVATLVRELIAFYRRVPGFSRVRHERHQFPTLDAALREEETHRRELIAAALRPMRASARLRAVAFALIDLSVYESLVASGLSHAAAIEEITTTLLSRLSVAGGRLPAPQHGNR